MGKDLFGGFGGLMKGLSGFMPKDDPNVKIMNATTELEEFREKETQLYAEVGKKAMAQNSAAYPDEAQRLSIIKSDIAKAEETLRAMTAEKEAAEKQESEARSALTCPECGTVNPEGVKFCQECGAKLGEQKGSFCGSCGAQNPPGTKFCGECGARL